MNKTLVFIGEGQTFDQRKIRRDLLKIGVTNLRFGDLIGSVLEGDYRFNEDVTIVRLSDDLQTISMYGTGDASLNLALELQRREPRPLRVTDLGYDFEFSLQSVRTVAEMRRKIIAEVFETEQPAPAQKVA